MKKRTMTLCCVLLCLLLCFGGCAEKTPVALQPGDSYMADHILYMSPHNSAIWFDTGDTGLRFTVEENALAWTIPGAGEDRRIEDVDWGWQPFPYTDEQWYAMFDTLLYQPLSETAFVLYLDGSLQLVNLYPCTEDSWCIYCVYSLVPEEK